MMKQLGIVTAALIALTTETNSARCGLPDPSNSECQGPAIKVVGHNGFVGDPLGQYCVTIRDFNNTPIPNAPVIIHFSGSDIQLCADQKDPDVTVDCAAQTVRKLSGADGKACFRVIGRRRSVDCAVEPPAPVDVFWDQTYLCGLFAPVYDLVYEPGVGVNGNDLSEFLHLFLDCGVYLSDIDYNANGLTDGDDFSQFLNAFFAAGSALGCDSKCP